MDLPIESKKSAPFLRLFSVTVRGGAQPSASELERWLTAMARPLPPSSTQIAGKVEEAEAATPGNLDLCLSLLCCLTLPTLGGALSKGKARDPLRQLYNAAVKNLVEIAVKSREVPSSLEPQKQQAWDTGTWMALLLLLNKFSELAKVVRSVLGFHVAISNLSLRTLSEAVTSAGSPLCQASHILPAVLSLSPHPISEGSRSAPPALVCCLGLLLTPHAVQSVHPRMAVEMESLMFRGKMCSAVYSCLKSAALPIHTEYVKLVQAYLHFQPPHTLSIGKNACQPGLTPAQLASLVLPCCQAIQWPSQAAVPDACLAQAALGTLHLLLLEEGLWKGRAVEKSLKLWAGGGRGGAMGELMERVTWPLLAERLEGRWQDFEALLPQWLSLVHTQMEHQMGTHLGLCKVSSGPIAPVQELSAAERASLQRPSGVAALMAQALTQPGLVQAALSTWQPPPVALGGQSGALEQAVVSSLLPLLLDASCPELCREAFRVWWNRLDWWSTQRLTPLLVEALSQGRSSRTAGRDRPGRQDAAMVLPDPLRMLRVDPSLFSCPALLAVLLPLLLRHLFEARRMAEAVLEGETGGAELAAGVLLQESAVCHALLDSVQNESAGRTECRSLLLEALAALLEERPLLLKLLHFQGYAVSLLPLLVEYMPSAFSAALSFVPSLLSSPVRQHQVMACHVTAHIAQWRCQHWQAGNEAETASMARMVVSYVRHVQVSVGGAVGFLKDTVEAVVILGSLFPELQEQASEVLADSIRISGPVIGHRALGDSVLYDLAAKGIDRLSAAMTH